MSQLPAGIIIPEDNVIRIQWLPVRDPLGKGRTCYRHQWKHPSVNLQLRPVARTRWLGIVVVSGVIVHNIEAATRETAADMVCDWLAMSPGDMMPYRHLFFEPPKPLPFGLTALYRLFSGQGAGA